MNQCKDCYYHRKAAAVGICRRYPKTQAVDGSGCGEWKLNKIAEKRLTAFDIPSPWPDIEKVAKRRGRPPGSKNRKITPKQLAELQNTKVEGDDA